MSAAADGANDPGQGCAVCLGDWNTRGTIDEQIAVSSRLQTYLYRCVVCGTLWEQVISNYPRIVTAAQAQIVLDAAAREQAEEGR